MTAKEGTGTRDNAEEVKFEITELTRGRSLIVPEHVFSEQLSRRFHQKYRTYEEAAAVVQSNRGWTSRSCC